MNTLFLAWRAGYDSQEACTEAQTRWFPIGRLDRDSVNSKYRFRYLKGAIKAQDQAGFSALDAFPDLKREYSSMELFSLFKNRIPNAKRKDFSDIVDRMDLRQEEADPFNILSVSGGTRQTDSLEIFPEIDKTASGHFECKFFVHGSRFVSEYAKKRINSIRTGDSLKICFEMANKYTGFAIQVQTEEDKVVIGYAPRYLLNDLQGVREFPESVEVAALKVNPSPAPVNQRILVSLKGKLPTDKENNKGEDFQLIE